MITSSHLFILLFINFYKSVFCISHRRSGGLITDPDFFEGTIMYMDRYKLYTNPGISAIPARYLNKGIGSKDLSRQLSIFLSL